MSECVCVCVCVYMVLEGILTQARFCLSDLYTFTRLQQIKIPVEKEWQDLAGQGEAGMDSALSKQRQLNRVTGGGAVGGAEWRSGGIWLEQLGE